MKKPKRITEIKPSAAWAYSRLMKRFGPQGWWPVGGRYHPGKFPKLTENQSFEIAMGAILTQNTAWTNVNKALTELRRAKALTPARILTLPDKKLAELIRSSGYFTQKAKKLKVLARFVLENSLCHSGESRNPGLDPGFHRGDELRNKLLSLWGVGPETADSILLYSLNQPVFVVDAYTRRIGERLGWGRWMKPSVKYDTIRSFFESRLKPSVPLYQEYHALLVELAKRHCRKNNPICTPCPLKSRCLYFSRLS